MRRRAKYIIIVCILFAQFNLQAKKVHDVINNKSIETQLISKDMDSDLFNYKTKIEVNYIQIAGATTKSAKKFNRLSLDLCTSYLTEERKAISINREMNERIRIYNELINSSSEYDYPNRNRGVNVPPKLKEMESDIVSMVGNLLFIEVKFIYEIPSSNNRYGRNKGFTFRHYYTYDLNSMKLLPWNPKMSRSQLDHIQKQIADQLNREYLLATSKLDRSDISLLETYDKEEKIEPSCKDICTKIDIADADFYWFAWGILIQFQEFTPSSKVYYGNSFNLFIPLERAKEIFVGIPQFDFLQRISVEKNQLKHFNLLEFQNSLSSYSSFMELHDLVDVISESKARTLITKRYQIGRVDKKEHYRGKTEVEFNTFGQVLSKSYFQEDDRPGTADYYTYDSLGNLTQHIRLNSRKEEESETYTYDRNYNLISIARMSKSELGNDLFFYNGNFIYRIQMSSIGYRNRNTTMQKYFLTDSTFGSNDNVFLFNKDHEVVGNTATKYVGNLFQVGYDSLGRKVESHRDRDRYNSYWCYDDLGRMVSFESYEYTKPRNVIRFLYKGDSKLPIERKTINTTGNTSIIMEDYSWEYFE